MAKSKEQNPGFEASLAQLERIVAQLESGDLPLEKALEIFENGVGLARRCQEQLTEAERKVELLLRERGEIKTVPFDPAKIGEAVEAAHPQTAAGMARKSAVSFEANPDEEDEEDEEVGGGMPF